MLFKLKSVRVPFSRAISLCSVTSAVRHCIDCTVRTEDEGRRANYVNANSPTEIPRNAMSRYSVTHLKRSPLASWTVTSASALVIIRKKCLELRWCLVLLSVDIHLVVDLVDRRNCEKKRNRCWDCKVFFFLPFLFRLRFQLLYKTWLEGKKIGKWNEI